MVASGAAAPEFLMPDDVKKPERWRLTTERGVYISIILHLLLVIFVIVIPPSKTKEKSLDELPDPLGLIKLMRQGGFRLSRICRICDIPKW